VLYNRHVRRQAWAIVGKLIVPVAIVAVLLTSAGTAGGRQAATITFSFQTYANNVKVVAPLVGRWQLGTARLRGSGRLAGDVLGGTIVDVTDPLISRYPPASMHAEVIGYSYVAGAHSAFTKLTLNVMITSATNGGPRCDPGVRGVITLYDSPAKLSNGERSDYVVMGHWTAARCPTFVQGWTNEDGGPRTSPARGGPPHGGQWAVVNIRIS
jgi:hypothetical protein